MVASARTSEAVAKSRESFVGFMRDILADFGGLCIGKIRSVWKERLF
jgi:hypothetical protein